MPPVLERQRSRSLSPPPGSDSDGAPAEAADEVWGESKYADADDAPPAGPAFERQRSRSLSPPAAEAPPPAVAAAAGQVESVRVMCRVRPPSRDEEAGGGVCVVEDDPDGRTVSCEGAAFGYSHVFGQFASQMEVYARAAQPLVEACLAGMNATVVAYGQTGSGKTHTMMGPHGDRPDRFRSGDPTNGVIPRAVDDLFAVIDSAPDGLVYEVRASFVEVYLEKVQDLLLPRAQPLRVREDVAAGAFFTDAAEVPVASTPDVMRLLREGTKNRQVGSTSANEHSSRSHAIFVLAVSSIDRARAETLSGSLTLVDLAGSEKAANVDDAPVQTPAERAKLMRELQNINASLLALGNVIEALTAPKRGRRGGGGGRGRLGHVPYRNSTLTKLLAQGFGGNGLTTLVVNVSPWSSNARETLSSLKFGSRAMVIRNKPTVNRRRNVAELREMLARANKTLSEQTWAVRALEQRIELYRRYCLRISDEIPYNTPGREELITHCPRGAAGRRVFNFCSDFMIALLWSYTNGRCVGRGCQVSRRFQNILSSDRLWQMLCSSEFGEHEDFQDLLKSNSVSFKDHYMKAKKRQREERLEKMRQSMPEDPDAGRAGIRLLRT